MVVVIVVVETGMGAGRHKDGDQVTMMLFAVLLTPIAFVSSKAV